MQLFLDTAPELHYTFIEQALHPGPALALHCAASGSPSPRFTWLLDGQALEEHNSPQRYAYNLNANDDFGEKSCYIYKMFFF